jgi:hypothetical protein
VQTELQAAIRLAQAHIGRLGHTDPDHHTPPAPFPDNAIRLLKATSLIEGDHEWENYASSVVHRQL